MDKIWIEKNIEHRKSKIAKNIPIFKIFLPNICHKLDKLLPIFSKPSDNLEQ